MRLVLAFLLLIPQAAQASLIFKTTMDSEAAITAPAVSQAVYNPPSGAILDASRFTFVTGKYGQAAQIDNENGNWLGCITFKAENFDWPDTNQDGGRMDLWVRFDEDPHSFWTNAWTFRSNWSSRNINVEMASASLMLDVYGPEPNGERTSYRKFNITPFIFQPWRDVTVNRWHQFTFLWRNNGSTHKDEIHYYIDGRYVFSDYNGNLPAWDTLTDMRIHPLVTTVDINTTLDEIYSFDSWDMTGVPAGNYANIVHPEAVTLKYPMHYDGPEWGEPVTDTNQPTFEFHVQNDAAGETTTDCELFVDGVSKGTVTGLADLEHAEITSSTTLSNGLRYWYVECDSARIVSPTHGFELVYSLPSPTFSSLVGGRFDGGYAILSGDNFGVNQTFKNVGWSQGAGTNSGTFTAATAAVEMVDSAVYANGTKYVPQVIRLWTNSVINFEVEFGTEFAAADTVTYFVIREDGEKVASQRVYLGSRTSTPRKIHFAEQAQNEGGTTQFPLGEGFQ